MGENEFFERLKSHPRPVVVDFYAPWCTPCRMIEPVIKRLGNDYKDRVDVWKVNADEQPEVLRILHIQGVPTVISFNNGQEVARQVGAAGPDVYARLFEAALSGERLAQSGPAPIDRLLRLGIGVVLFILAAQARFSGYYLLAAFAGAAFAFSAVYDRCPVYQAISGRIKNWLEKKS